MTVNTNSSMPYMKSLATCLKRMISEGYTEDFKVTDSGLEAQNKHNNYQPEQVQVVNFFRFEHQSNPHDKAILYVIETNDGTKGTLIENHVFSDATTNQFMKRVQNIQKPSKNFDL
jgi:hypothetical protein